jgi:DNA-binding transcriptional MerR regulator
LRLHGPDKPVYTIGVVARLLGTSPQALRIFEREGLVAPSRTEANIRLYSQNELVVLRRICELVKIERVNIAGVRAVLRIERRYGVINVYDLRADFGGEQEQDTPDQTGAGRDVPERGGPR